MGLAGSVSVAPQTSDRMATASRRLRRSPASSSSTLLNRTGSAKAATAAAAMSETATKACGTSVNAIAVAAENDGTTARRLLRLAVTGIRA